MATFTLLPGEGYRTLKITGTLGPEQIKLFESQELVKLLETPVMPVVINCENLSIMAKQWIRVFLNLGKKLEEVNSSMVFIQASKEITDFWKREGVDRAFENCGGLRDALVKLKLVTKKALDVDFINPFLHATIEVLKIQASTQAKSGKPYIQKEQETFLGDISGVIGLVTETFSGSVVISFPEQTFLKIISKMLGETYTKLSKEIEDGAGELTNIIFGQAKVVLNEKGYGIRTALPSVVSGKDHSVKSLTNGQIVVVPFESDSGSFFIEIFMSS